MKNMQVLVLQNRLMGQVSEEKSGRQKQEQSSVYKGNTWLLGMVKGDKSIVTIFRSKEFPCEKVMSDMKQEL